MDKETKICAIVLAFLLVLLIAYVSHLKNQDYQIKIAQLETELTVRKEETEKEIEKLQEAQNTLLKENDQLKRMENV